MLRYDKSDDSYSQEVMDFLVEIVDREEISGNPLGIAKQALDRGIASLSTKQLNVIQRFIESYQNRNECDVCLNDNVNSFIDSIYVADFGTCAVCEEARNKFMAD